MLEASGLLASNPLSGQAYLTGGFFGLLALALVLFAETGLLIGFFLPGDTLLLLAGFHTKAGVIGPHFNYFAAALFCIIGAFVGAQTGFAIGRAAGPRLFTSPQRREGVAKAQKVIDRVGAERALVIGRFVPLVRTFINPAVGITGLSAPRFVTGNAIGAIIWPPIILFLGRLLPKSREGLVDKGIILVVLVSLCIPLVEAIRRRRAARS